MLQTTSSPCAVLAKAKTLHLNKGAMCSCSAEEQRTKGWLNVDIMARGAIIILSRRLLLL